MPNPAINKKEKYSVEFEVKASARSLYNLLSTASGMEGWFAEKVTISNGDFVFHWEGSEERARLVKKIENQLVRYKRITEDKKDDTYFQFEIVEDEITGDIALIVTDFSLPEEKEENIRLWSSEVHELLHSIGS